MAIRRLYIDIVWSLVMPYSLRRYTEALCGHKSRVGAIAWRCGCRSK